MDVLLSVRPEYTEKLFSGEKLYEFRKRKPKEIIGRVLIYESRRSRKILGWFSVRTIHSGSPGDIWERCKDHSGIEKKRYLSYCNGNKVIHALEIDHIFRFNPPRNPFDMIPDFKPPQDFVYLPDGMIQALNENEDAG
jgi:predicted transcriptional regulator